MLETKYRDNLAGALNHRAVGLLNMAKCGKHAKMIALQLPCWLEGQPLKAIAAQAVNDLRQACTLRSAGMVPRPKLRAGVKPIRQCFGTWQMPWMFLLIWSVP